MSDALLARYADCITWLGRYVERAENLARILDVNEVFARDSEEGQNWRSIIQLYGEQPAFYAKHAVANADTVLDWCVRDADNPNSLIGTIWSARENARSLRPLISTEMWMQLNMFHRRVARLDAGELSPHRRNQFFAWVKEACQLHTGIAEGTLHRDQAWYFYGMGRMIERADQTTRLLDMKYHLLLPSVSDVGSPVDESQWNALLRCAAGYHAYRRVHAGGMTPSLVAGFLLLNRRFPRSVLFCVNEALQLLLDVRSRYGLRAGTDAAETLDWLRSVLAGISIDEVIGKGLHEFLDMIQLRLVETGRQVGEAFFGHGA